jgi:2-polyprenyl-3-methyl-5-hydroxy-6-metoxy-1,4-benzoquinol methylase
MAMLRVRQVERDALFLNTCKGKRVLHIGCADAPLYRERHNTGTLLHAGLMGVARELVGIDSDAEGIRYLKETLGYSGIIEGDAMALEGIDLGGLFDVVVAGEVLEHLSNPGLCLTGLRSVLAANGELLVSVPNAFSVKGMIRVMAGRELVHPDHVSYYSPSTLARLLQKEGFEVEFLGAYVSHSFSTMRRVADTIFLGGLRRFCPALGDGLVACARVHA